MGKYVEHPWVLGLDIGAQSVGWALLDGTAEVAKQIVATGVRAFDAAVEGDYETGKDVSRAAARRDARMPRRQTWRRQWRRRKLLRLLQDAAMMPEGDTSHPDAVHELIRQLDATIKKNRPELGATDAAHTAPYILRRLALDERLAPYEIGRAIYHLAQRRGFLSNRKSDKADKETGKVKEDISALEQAMDDAGARTLGEYLASLDLTVERIRRRWTSSKKYEDEFNDIWSAQAKHHPALLDDESKERIHDAIFFQRPLKSQKHLIGRCSLMPNRRRARLALRIAQRFRLLQKVNDLKIRDGIEGRSLTDEERRIVLDALSTKGDVTFKGLKAKKFLGLQKTATFTHEEGGEKKLVGHRTDEKLRKVFGKRWDALTESERDQVVEDVLSYEKSDALVRRGVSRWGLTTEQAEQLADEVAFEDGYSAHCVPALRQLVAEMEDGTSYSTARDKLFRGSLHVSEVYDELPPLSKVSRFRDLRNPAVIRALTELRKVVNALIHEHGKPDFIHIELARHLKNPRKVRKAISDRNRENQRERDAAKAAIIAEGRIPQPKGIDIEKYRLAEECHWTCPYTGRTITMGSLFGPSPQFDIEHILPLSQSLDNTFFNKTLCEIEENRNRKGKRTPYEAYAGDEQRYHEILERVSRFSGRARAEKLRRFKMEKIPDGFTLRQLTDTAYSSRLAAEYVGLLYGGVIDAEGNRPVQVSAGGVTHHLRNVLMLNAVLPSLPDSPAHCAPEDVSLREKLRVDHRHHAVDAVAIALATDAMVQRLANAAKDAEREGARRPFLAVKDPWPGFLEDVRNAIDQVVVSHRVDRRLAGPLHEETNYSKPHQVARKAKGKTALVEYHHVRKPLANMSLAEVKQIVDPIVRQLVDAKLAEIGGEPKKVFASEGNLPHHTTRDGRRIPIRKARIRKRTNIIDVGKGPRHRWVAPGSNHHMEIVAVLDKDAKPRKWEGHLVSRFEAVQRRKRGEPIYQRDFGEGKRFEFSLAPGEMIEVESDKFGRGPFIIRGITGQRIYYARHNDARLKTDIIKAGDWFRPSIDTLMKAGCRKIRVDYLGRVYPAND